MSYAIQNLSWELQPAKLQLLDEASSKMSEAMEHLKQALDVPELREINY